MIIVIEGPDKSGKSHLIGKTLAGFDPDRSYQKVFSNPDEQDGFGYMPELDEHLNSDIVSVWHRGWVSESAYGSLLGQPRLLAENEFLGEWFYTRPLLGRGGNFILLPEDPAELGIRRDDTDFDNVTVNPIAEYEFYKLYAERWGYDVLLNDYQDESENTKENVLRLRRSAFGLGAMKLEDDDYIGSTNPMFTFVGQISSEMSSHRPFYSRAAARYFRQFGQRATRRFGYATMEAYELYRRKHSHLFANVFTVGGAAARRYPELPNLPVSGRLPSEAAVKEFRRAFDEGVAARYSWVR